MAVDSGLTVSGLTKTYASAATGRGGGVHDTSFALRSGTFFTLLGPSGCGKTTTLRSIAGLERPQQGTIRLGGDTFFDAERGTNVAPHLRNIGMVFQSYAIWPHMTVAQNLAFPLKMDRTIRMSGAEMQARIEETLALVSLGDMQQRYPSELSGGQQQRVALARAIIRRPRLLLLDEPLSNLDAVLREEMRVELRKLQRQIGITAVYVTHDQSEALEMSDLIGVMSGGRLEQLGTPADVFFRPANRFVAEFMGATNFLDGVIAGSVRDGIATVQMADGTLLKCRAADSQGPGTQACVSVRPEAFARSGTDAGEGAANRLTGRVVNASFMGFVSRLHLDLNGTPLQANVHNGVAVEPGQLITLSFSQDDAIALAARGTA